MHGNLIQFFFDVNIKSLLHPVHFWSNSFSLYSLQFKQDSWHLIKVKLQKFNSVVVSLYFSKPVIYDKYSEENLLKKIIKNYNIITNLN
jgi:hypothetical protein